MVPAYEGKEPYLFVSYAHKNSDLVLPVIGELFEKKYRIWYDEGIAAGSEWPKNIADHLNGAASYLIFTSKESLASKNCENEVTKALEMSADGSRKIYRYDLGAEHEKLKDAETVRNTEELISKLPEKFIGDGTGYERKVGKGRRFGLWNLLILLAACLALLMGIGLYGLDQGWFDQILPGLKSAQENAKQPESAARDESQENIVIENDLLAQAVAGQLGKSELTEALKFDNDEEKNSFYAALGFDGSQDEMTLLDLTGMPCEEVRLDPATNRMLEYLTYCPDLKKVIIPYREFPLTIPETAAYEVVMQ